MRKLLFAFLTVVSLRSQTILTGGAKLTGRATVTNLFSPVAPDSGLTTPTAFWVLNSNGTTINSLIGTHVLTYQTGTGGPSPLYNVGGQDGQGLLTGRPASATGNLYGSYMDTTSTGDLTMSNTDATVLVCGRPNSWEVNSGGSAIPSAGVGAFRKSGEWTLALGATTATPFQVTVGGSSFSAGPPPVYSVFSPVAPTNYPQSNSGAYMCTWGFWDHNAQTVSAAYNDGPSGAAVSAGGAITLSGLNTRVAESSLANELTVAGFWPVLLTRQERSTLWNGMLRNQAVAFAAGGISSWKVYEINPATDLGDNAWSQNYGAYVRESEFATFKFTVTPIGTPTLKPAFAVKYNSLYRLGVRRQAEQDIGIRVDGAYFGFDYPLQLGVNIGSFSLPNDGQPHTVEVRVGSIGASVYGVAANPQDTLEGSSLDSVYVPQGYNITPIAPSAPSTTLVYADSIAGGTQAEATSSPFNQLGPRVNMAWNQLCRYASPTCFPTTNLATEAYGGRLLNNDCSTQVACDAFFDNVLSKYKNIQIMWAAIGINDVSHTTPSVCLAGFTLEYGYLLNSFHARYPSAPFYAQSPLNTSAVTNDASSGCTPVSTVAQYRTAIQTACTNAGAWCHFVDGTAAAFPQLGQTPVQISSDNLHPSAFGYYLYAQAVAAIMGNGATITYPQ